MLILENIGLAITGLWSNKMRALLTMLGIIIGIGSVIGIVTVGNSMTNGINESLQSMGVSNITISLTQKTDENTTSSSGQSFFMFGRSNPSDDDLITDEMLSEYQERFSDKIAYITMSESLGSGSAKYSTDTSSVSVSGVNLDYKTANSIEIATGRFLNSDDEEKQKNVCVVASTLCGELFPMEDPVGKTLDVTIGNSTYVFYIVGAYDNSSSTSSLTSSSSTTMYIPLSTAKKLAGSSDGYSSVTVVASVGTDTTSFITQTNSFFTQLYSRNKSYTATASSMESMVETMTSMLSTISTAIAVIAGISLLVGGIGVMNIMLVSITERTREIGTRKALGATNNSIRLQFIVESIIICLIGGIIGIAMGMLIGDIGANMLGYSAKPSLSVIAIAVGFSMAIGVFFGYYPANKAAKLDPIEALRYE